MMQNIIQGINKLPQILDEINSKKLFIVVDSSYPFLNIKEALEALEVKKVLFSDFTPNPLYEQVCKGIDLIKAEDCDSILAVGGGSAIDVAKCIKLAIMSKKDENIIFPSLVLEHIEVNDNLIPLIAIPTTAGTGSESTHNAVIYYKGVKQTITSDNILPDYALLEMSVLNTLPLYQKKCTMMDALCQGIESWWSVNSTAESWGYSYQAIKLIMDNWSAYIFDNDVAAAANIMLGANYSGRAINIAQTTAAHAMSYKITSLYKLPHGHAVAVNLPEVWQYMLLHMDECLDNRGQEYLTDIFYKIAFAMGVDTPLKAIILFRKMMTIMELQNPVAINREQELGNLTTSVNPVRLRNSPVKLDIKAIRRLYEVIVH